MKTREGKCKQERALKSSTCSAYVYEIQVDGVVRYIGKGRNGRVYSHLIDAKRTALRPGIKVQNLSPFFRRKLVEAVKRRSTIEEKIIASNGPGGVWGRTADDWRASQKPCRAVAEHHRRTVHGFSVPAGGMVEPGGTAVQGTETSKGDS